jgi:hypothetical protein
MADRRISGFKRFSDMKAGKKAKEVEEVSPSVRPDDDTDIPMNPNLSKKSNKIEKPRSRKGIIPKDQDINLPGEETESNETDVSNEAKVETFGKVARFPKNVKASKAFNFLEAVKISKKSIWYIMVEKQDSELQMVKYNNKEGVDLNKFVTELKGFYLKKHYKDKKVCKLIEAMHVDGNDKYSMIKNIPLIEVDGKKMISVITGDLIRLLSK